MRRRSRRRAVTLAGLASCFLQIALSSFGGGLSAWTQRIVVERRRWLDNEQFLSAITIARLFPGPNQVNMAIYIGEALPRPAPARWRRWPACSACRSPSCSASARAYFHFHTVPALRATLSGVVAAAAGMALSMGFKLIGNYCANRPRLLFAAAAFAGVSVLHVLAAAGGAGAGAAGDGLVLAARRATPPAAR